MQQQPQPDGTPQYPPYYPPQQPPLPPPAIERAAHPLACMACGSENTRAVPAIFDAGISNTTSRTTGIGVSRGGLGVGTATTHGTSQTVLSQKLAPPAKQPTVKILFGGLFGFMILGAIVGSSSHALGTVITYGGWAVAAFLAYKAFRFNRDEYPTLRGRWERSFMCDRCANVFVPGERSGFPLPPQPAIVS